MPHTTDFLAERQAMVREQLAQRGIHARQVLEAMEQTPRHLFVSSEMVGRAYDDCALPSEEGQTISQPYMVAVMTEALAVEPGDCVLEIGTGTGYQTAILAMLVREVYTIERVASLSASARQRLDALAIGNVHFAVGDGTLGWQEPAADEFKNRFEGFFNRIIVTAGAPVEPAPLLAQLAVGGRMVIPKGGLDTQTLTVVQKLSNNTVERRMSLDCRFVPLVGEHGWKGDDAAREKLRAAGERAEDGRR